MVAPKADDLIWRPFLKVDQEVYDTATIRPSINVVAEENKFDLLGTSISLAQCDETLQLIQASVDIAAAVGRAQDDSLSCWGIAVPVMAKVTGELQA